MKDSLLKFAQLQINRRPNYLLKILRMGEFYLLISTFYDDGLNGEKSIHHE